MSSSRASTGRRRCESAQADMPECVLARNARRDEGQSRNVRRDPDPIGSAARGEGGAAVVVRGRTSRAALATTRARTKKAEAPPKGRRLQRGASASSGSSSAEGRGGPGQAQAAGRAEAHAAAKAKAGARDESQRPGGEARGADGQGWVKKALAEPALGRRPVHGKRIVSRRRRRRRELLAAAGIRVRTSYARDGTRVDPRAMAEEPAV